MRLFASSHLSLKRTVGTPIFTPAKAMKSGAGSSTGAVAHSLPWVDAAREGLKWGAEEARLALGGRPDRGPSCRGGYGSSGIICRGHPRPVHGGAEGG
jgi:hypothetical protein